MKKIHFKHGCVRGRYATVYSDTKLSESRTEVTCKICLDFLSKHNLRDRSEFEEIPTFDVVASGDFYYAGSSNRGCHLTFDCPVCGKINSHGGEYGILGGGDGHRCSHCECWKDGYYIHEVPKS